MARYPRDAMGVPEDMLNISDRKVTAHEFACLSGSGSHNRKTDSIRHAIWGFSVQSHREGRNEEKADGRSARMLAYKSQNTGRVGDVRILKWITALVALLSLMSLVGCTTRTVESINLTPENTECRASAYEGLVRQYASDFDPWRYRHLIVSTLSQIATSVWRMEPRATGTCQVRYQIEASMRWPYNGVMIPSTVTFFVEPSRVCLNHIDKYGPDVAGIRVPDAEIEHPWRWVSQGRVVAGLPPGYFARREYLPVCFDRNGEIEGYLDD